MTHSGLFREYKASSFMPSGLGGMRPSSSKPAAKWSTRSSISLQQHQRTELGPVASVSKQASKSAKLSLISADAVIALVCVLTKSSRSTGRRLLLLLLLVFVRGLTPHVYGAHEPTVVHVRYLQLFATLSARVRVPHPCELRILWCPIANGKK